MNLLNLLNYFYFLSEALLPAPYIELPAGPNNVPKSLGARPWVNTVLITVISTNSDKAFLSSRE